jgi:site-specific recombinase XerC
MNFPPTKIPQSKLQVFIQQFDGAMPHARKTTKHVYRKALDQLLSFADHDTFDFTPDVFREFRFWLLNKKGLSTNTVNVYLTACRRFCDFLVEIGILQNNPALNVHGTAPEFKVMRMNLAEVASIISKVDRSTVLGKRDFAFLSAIFEAGVSISELINANVGDFRKDGSISELYVKHRDSGDRSEVIALPKCVATAIDDYLGSRGEITSEQPLFSTVRRGSATKVRLSLRGARFAMDRWLKVGEGNKIRLDSLRTYCVVRLMSKGKTSEEIRSIMRFKSNMPFRRIMFNAKNITR